MNVKRVLLSMASLLVMLLVLSNSAKASTLDIAALNFEQSLQGCLPANVTSNGAYGTEDLSRDQTIVYAGDYSLKVQCTSGTGKYMNRVSFPKDVVVPGRKIRLNFYIPQTSYLTEIQLVVGGTRTNFPVLKKGEWFPVEWDVPSSHFINQFFIDLRFSISNAPTSDIYIDSISSSFTSEVNDYNYHNFEGNIDTNLWYVNNETQKVNSAYGTGSVEPEVNIKYAGRKSLKINLDGGLNKDMYRFVMPTDGLINGNKFTFRFYIPIETDLNLIQVHTNTSGTSNLTIKNFKGAWYDVEWTGNVNGATLFWLNIRLSKDATGYVKPSVIYIDSLHNGSDIVIPTKAPDDPMKTSNFSLSVSEGGTVDLFTGGLSTTVTPTAGYSNQITRRSYINLQAYPEVGFSFAYWKNKINGAIISASSTYYYYVGTGADIEAVFRREVTQETTAFTVIFKDKSGRILKTDKVNRGESAIPPENPSVLGHSFVGWDKDFSNVTSDLIVTAVYQKADTTYTVTVINGAMSTGGTSGNYTFDTKVTVIANDPAVGEIFSHWEIDGQKASFDSTYTLFVPMKNITLNAVYINYMTTVETLPFVSLTSEILLDVNNGSLTLSATSVVPVGYTLIECGIMFLNSDITPSDFTLDTPGVMQGRSRIVNSGQYNIRLVNASVGTWYGRAYLIYQDTEGNTYTTYSGIATIIKE